jgi:hypothetical protein
MSGITLKETAAASIPTPAASKATVFLDSADGVPKFKDDAGAVTSLVGATGANGEGVPAGGTAGQVLSKIDGTDYNTEWATVGGSSGDVVGPASATANALALFDGTTGKLLKDSTYTITAAGAALLDDATASDQRTTLGLGSANAPTFKDVTVDETAGNSRDFQWSTAGSLRWVLRCDGTAESGSNAGSDLQLLARTDAGAALGTAFSIVRSTQVVTFPQSPIVPTPTAGTDSTAAASTAFVWGAAATIRQNSQSAAYTLVAGDAGKHIYHPSTDANARTFTIPANASVAFPVGTTVTFVNETSQVVTIAITTDTLVLAGTGSTGSRSLAQYGMATALKVSSTRWIISGTGLT